MLEIITSIIMPAIGLGVMLIICLAAARATWDSLFGGDDA